MKRFFALLILLGFASVLRGEEPDVWRIEAGPVRIAPGEPAELIGIFRVIAPAGTLAEAAPRSGGACLVADLTPFGIGLARCNSHSDCNGPDSIDASDPRLEGFRGYCASRDGSGEPPHCWTRPGPPQTHCQRSIDGLRLTQGAHELGPVNADPLGNGGPLPEWAVYACMADEGHDRACGQRGGGNRQTSLTPLPGAGN